MLEVSFDESRYDRQSLITWWDQQRLAKATVIVVGAGALGNEILKNLALLGVGRVVVVDGDHIEHTNLARCVLFRDGDEGKPKAEVAAAAAASLNPSIEVIGVIGKVEQALGLRVFAEADVVIGGLDNREARLHVNQACWKTSTPWVDGAIEGLMGVVRAFQPPDSSCYECTLSQRDYEILAARRACSLLTRAQMDAGRTPTTATTASVIAGIQVQEAIKLLHRDLGVEAMSGWGVAFNGVTHDTYRIEYPRRETCVSHDTYDLAAATVVGGDTTFATLLADGEAAFGADVVLELEHDVAIASTCLSCGHSAPIRRILSTLDESDARCSRCDAELQFDVRHAVGADQLDLLAMRPSDLGLNAYDVITARRGVDRRHYLLGGPGSAIVALRHDG